MVPLRNRLFTVTGIGAWLLLSTVSPLRVSAAEASPPLLFFMPSATGTGTSFEAQNRAVRAIIVSQSLERLPKIFDTQLANADLGDDAAQTVERACRERGTKGAVQAAYSFTYNPKGYSQVEVRLALRDCGTLGWGSVKGVAESDAGTTLEELVAEAGRDACNHLASSWRHVDAAVHHNFIHTGLLLEDDEKTGLFGLIPCKDGACVRFAEATGTAARAGLRADDIVLSINGTSTHGLNADALRALLVGTDRYAFVVRGPSGAQRSLSFSAEPPSWYAENPLPN